jgi:hypothetical protein
MKGIRHSLLLALATLLAGAFVVRSILLHSKPSPERLEIEKLRVQVAFQEKRLLDVERVIQAYSDSKLAETQKILLEEAAKHPGGMMIHGGMMMQGVSLKLKPKPEDPTDE